ncbi:MAG: sensor histidine kinase [Planctomycetaceae bacterium]
MAEDMKPEAVERLNNLGHLSSAVGHHVINAFSAIVSNVELLRLKPPLPAAIDPAALADTIIHTALDAATVARRLIDYARPVTSIEPEHALPGTGAVELDRLVGQVVADERRDGSPEVVWETDLAPIPPIRGHATQLRAMLGHLIANAYESMPERKGTIRLTTGTDTRGWVVLELRDSGRGMEGEILQRAIEPFFSTKSGHLGIGLSIANGIWRRHRGTLSILSRPGEGTALRLCVEPCHD